MDRPAREAADGARDAAALVGRWLAAVALLVAVPYAAAPASAHGNAHGQEGVAKAKPFVESETNFGRAIRASQARRTIEVDMSDAMRFSPAEIRVRRGEQVRIVVRNNGKLLHEMVLGSRDELEKHAALMRKFPTMEHDEPFMAHVDPGGTGEILWQFTKSGEFFYGCLVPGHFEAGMAGRIVVVD